MRRQSDRRGNDPFEIPRSKFKLRAVVECQRHRAGTGRDDFKAEKSRVVFVQLLADRAGNILNFIHEP